MICMCHFKINSHIQRLGSVHFQDKLRDLCRVFKAYRLLKQSWCLASLLAGTDLCDLTAHHFVSMKCKHC